MPGSTKLSRGELRLLRTWRWKSSTTTAVRATVVQRLTTNQCHGVLVGLAAVSASVFIVFVATQRSPLRKAGDGTTNHSTGPTTKSYQANEFQCHEFTSLLSVPVHWNNCSRKEERGHSGWGSCNFGCTVVGYSKILQE